MRRRFARALSAWRARPLPAALDRLLDAALDVLQDLKAIVLDPAPSPATENIYQKRHIAAGIPSIYGNYSEPKFDALGLSFRVENLVDRLLEDLVEEGVEPYVTRDHLRRMTTAIGRFERALAIDGVDSRALAANLALLEASFSSRNFTFGQYQNVFQFLVSSVIELSMTLILSHNQVLHAVLTNDPRQCEARHLSVDAVAEMVLREVLVSALGMQTLDRYAAAALRQIAMLNGRLGVQALTRMMNYDPERLVSPIHKPKATTDDRLSLGYKGLGLKEMASLPGLRVPEGFIMTNELFGAMPAMSYRPLYADTVQRVRRALGQMERQTGARLGDQARPLLLSIRSGAAMSMPGLMTTFVNVGLNDALTEALAAKQLGWAAWDSYRRFLQTWAMSDGIDRDFFDAIIAEFKVHYGVEQKLDFTVAQMREVAFAYKLRAREEGAVFVDDPFDQVVACILKVLESWDSSPARLYRQYTGVAEEWGTAVVVQRMVFGNLSRESGSGVTFTHNPFEPYSRQVRLSATSPCAARARTWSAGWCSRCRSPKRSGSAAPRTGARSIPWSGTTPPSTRSSWLSGPSSWSPNGSYDPAGDRVHLRRAARPRAISASCRSAPSSSSRSWRRTPPYFDTTSPQLRAIRWPSAWACPGGAYAGRVALAAGADRSMLARRGARREHRAAAPGHGARGHRHDRPGQRRPHGARRGHVARRRHGQAPGQDRRGRLQGSRGDRARGLGAPRRGRTARRRVAVDRWAHRQHLPGPHPDLGTPGAA